MTDSHHDSRPATPFPSATHGRSIGVVGLGYVGLPVAVAFGRSGAKTIGFDVNERRIAQLVDGNDITREVEPDELAEANIGFSAKAEDLAQADFFIVTVPTPIDSARRPDLSILGKASETVGRAICRGAIIVYESTVYPGATEEFCMPILEKISGLRAGVDFSVGYSPERINPGDRAHRFETIRKIVAGQDDATLRIISKVYGSVVKAGIYEAASIRVAEAAKVIENTQRDLNIALMNELSHIFHLLGIDTTAVLEAAGTKWNFLPFTPGLVGGHCIGVDPYYLTHRAEIAGYHPEVILAGRRINDGVGARIAQECVRMLMRKKIAQPKVTVLGLTFKEDVTDIRNSKVIDIVNGLLAAGVEVAVHDPHADPAETLHEYGISLVGDADLKPANALILAVPHAAYLKEGWSCIERRLLDGEGIVMDVKSKLDQAAVPSAVQLWRL